MSKSRQMGDSRARKAQPRESPPGAAFPGTIRWIAPLFTPTGYGDEARGFVKGLRQLGFPVKIAPVQTVTSFAEQIAADDPQFFLDAVATMSEADRRPTIAVIHMSAAAPFQPVTDADYTVVRTMFETDGLHRSIVDKLNAINEVWVPSQFNADSFRAAGVNVPIHVIGAGVDARRFRPGIDPLPLPGRRGTVFLAMFEWSHRKGWDVLLRAWAQAFRPDEDVTLVLRVYPRGAFENTSGLAATADRMLEEGLETLGLERGKLAPIITIGRHLPPPEVPRLLAAADCYVAPSRGEGWGRPTHEAMAMGLPVIATNWSGNLAFMNDENALLLDVNDLVAVDTRMDVPQYAGQRWAEPSTEHLAVLLGQVAEDPAMRKRIGVRARQDIEARWQWHAAAARAGQHILEIAAGLPEPNPERVVQTDALAPVLPIHGPRSITTGTPGTRAETKPALLLADAREVLEDGSVLATYCRAFAADSAVILLIYGVGLDAGDFETQLRAIVGHYALSLDSGPKIHALLPPTDEDDAGRRLASTVVAQLTRHAQRGPLARIPVITPGDPEELRRQVGILQARADPAVAADATGTSQHVPGNKLPEARLFGFFESSIGLGEAGRRTLAAMEAAEIVCATVLLEMPGLEKGIPFAHRLRDPSPDHVIVTCINAEVLLALVQTNGIGVLDGRYRIGLWHWELESFPAALLPAVDILDEIWVSSEHTRRTIQAVTEKPVIVVPMPIILRSEPSYSRRDLGMPEGFIFGFSFDYRSLVKRKNPAGLVKAFCNAFAPGEGPLLVIKSTGGDFQPSNREELRSIAESRPDIRLLEKQFTSEEQSSFIGLLDCYVSLHRAEGFGLTMAEAMAWGKPVVATGWSGNLDFMDEKNSYLVPWHIGTVPEGEYILPAGSLWADPDLDAAAATLREIWLHPEQARAVGERARESIRRTHGLEAASRVARNRFSAIAAGHPLTPAPSAKGNRRP